MGEPLEWLIENTIAALRPAEREIGLGTVGGRRRINAQAFS